MIKQEYFDISTGIYSQSKPRDTFRHRPNCGCDICFDERLKKKKVKIR